MDTPNTQSSAATKAQPAPATPPVDSLPPFKVLLHNDDVNDQLHVVESLVQVTPLTTRDAFRVMTEAHAKGLSLVMTTHRERAELYAERLQSKGLTATVEADR